MLARIRDTMKTLRTATAGQLAAELSEDRESVEAALVYWRNRGRIRTLPIVASGSSLCGGCDSCAPGLSDAWGGTSTIVGRTLKSGTRALIRGARISGPGTGALGVAYEWIEPPVSEE